MFRWHHWMAQMFPERNKSHVYPRPLPWGHGCYSTWLKLGVLGFGVLGPRQTHKVSVSSSIGCLNVQKQNSSPVLC